MDQAKVEREIFESFAKVAPFKILPGTIESRNPPEPDILCRIEGQGKVGFELTELIDQTHMARIGLMFKTKQHLNNYWQSELDAADVALFLSKFSDALLHFDYSQTTSFNERKVASKKAFPKLLHLPDSCDGEFLNSDPELTPVLQCVQVRRVGLVHPIFDVGSYGSLGDPTSQAIKNKFSKNYKCDYPIELLAHINWGIMPHEDVWKNSAQNAASQISNSPFRKVWVFDMTDKKIKFEFEKSNWLA